MCTSIARVHRAREHASKINETIRLARGRLPFDLVRSNEICTPDKALFLRHTLGMRKTLTARLCETLACPPTRSRIEYRDTVMPGLGLRVTSTGRKTFS